MNKDFELFKREFKKWQDKFGLTGYKVYFKYESLDGCFANISIDLTVMVATVRLSSKRDKESAPYKDIKQSAKHEAIHLLTGRLEKNACYRYSTENEIYEASEELVHKLEDLLTTT